MDILSIKRQYVRHYHGIHLPIRQVIKACYEQQHIMKFAWQYLCSRFGVHNFKHVSFRSASKHYLEKEIRDKYRNKYYPTLKRWSGKKMHLDSQVANEFLMEILNNFDNYISRLRKDHHKMKIKQRIAYECNADHNNPLHHKWYHIGSFNYCARRYDKRDIFTVTIPNNNQAMVLDKHHLKYPSIGVLHTKENIKNLNAKAIRLLKIKVRANHSTDVQFVFNNKYKVNCKYMEHNAVGIDYNQHDNEILCLYDNRKDGSRGKVIKFNNHQYKKLLNLQKQIKTLQSKYQHCLGNTKNQTYHFIEDKINYLKALQVHLVDEEYIHFAHQVCNKYDCICMESLDAKEMRLQGRGNTKDLNINHRLKTLKPYRLLNIFKDIAMKEHKEIIFVNSKYTTQTDYGTDTVVKHDVGVESWTHHGKYYKRDPNAAHNILDWSLHPKHHILYRRHKIKNVKDLVSVY